LIKSQSIDLGLGLQLDESVLMRTVCKVKRVFSGAHFCFAQVTVFLLQYNLSCIIIVLLALCFVGSNGVASAKEFLQFIGCQEGIYETKLPYHH
jgi:hypothetical protein